MTSHTTLLVVCGDLTALNTRRPQLMQQFRTHYVECHVAGPVADCPQNVLDWLKEIGFHVHPLEFSNQGLGPVNTIGSASELRKLLRQLQPSDLFAFHLKPILISSVISRLCRVQNRNFLFAGLGVLYAPGASIRLHISRWLSGFGLRFGLKNARNVFFQNPDDPETLRFHQVIDESSHVCTVNGSGVCLHQFPYSPVTDDQVEEYRNGTLPVEFTLISRMLRSKGVADFVEAAGLLRKEGVNARFTLIGPIDQGPDRIDATQWNEWCRSGLVEYRGEITNVAAAIQQSSVIVLPSYYMEGTPRILLEALAIGRPIITTDARGCRETVTDGANGYLIMPKNAEQLASRMKRYVESPNLLKTHADESRRLAEAKFDVNLINRLMLTAMLHQPIPITPSGSP